jgi:nucleoside-diphosphate-sugar epimerase
METGDLCLVSGVSGYLGSWIARELIENGYRVRGSVRDLGDVRRNAALKMLLPGIELVAADLRQKAGWADAMKGAKWVFHVASPQAVKTERNRTEGAVSGTKYVLAAAFAAPTVRKIVVTSSEAAIAYGHPRSKRNFDERDWTDASRLGKGADYLRSKTMAERLAWDWAEDASVNQRRVPLATVNPALILGPSLVPWGRFSLNMMNDIAQGKMPLMVDMRMRVVDVRDCARMHVAVMASPESNGRRHLSFGAAGSFAELARIVAKGYGDLGFKPAARVAPHWLARVLALVSSDVSSIWNHIGNDISYQTQSPGIYNYQHRDLNAIVHASMDSMLQHGWLSPQAGRAAVNPA